MRQHLRFAGAAGLLIATSAGLSAARGQEPVRAAGTEAATASSAGQGTQLMIAHALDMAIAGSELQLTIRQAGGQAAAGKETHVEIPGVVDVAVTRTRAPGDDPGKGTGHGGLVQLQQQARRSFRNSYELMKASNRLLRAGAETRDDRATSSRFYAAANLYANTLYAIARETFGWQAGWEPNDRSPADQGGESSVHPGASGARLSTADLATVTLINYSVKESLNAFELSQALRNASAGDGATRALREHARAMAADSRQSVEQILASLKEKAEAAGSDANAPGNRAAAEGHASWSGTQVQGLAQQAREVVRMLEELGGEAGRSR
jgi:hypothetical protein